MLGRALYVLILAAPSAFAQGAKPVYMREGKQQSITITSNVAKATVMEDGLFVGHAGAAFDSSPGVHELIIGAPGYVPRLIRVNLTGKSLTRQVNLAPGPDKNVDIEIDFKPAKSFVAKKSLAALPSLCAAYNRAPGKVSRDLMLGCRRETILDDFAFLGRSWLPEPQVDDGGLTQNVAKAGDDAFYWAAEELFAARPTDAHAATVLGLSAVMRQDCSRLLEVAMEHGSYKVPAPGLIFLRGLCFEMASQPDKAARLYLHLASSKPPPTDVLYHLARVQSPIAPTAAVKTLRVCTRAYAAFYPCYEATAQVQTIFGQEKEAEKTMTLYHKRTRAVLAEIFDKRDKLDADKVRAAFAERPYSFELATANAIVQTKTGAPLPPLPVDTTLVSEPAVVKQLVPFLQDTVAPDVLTPIYVLLTRNFPNDPTSWIRLAAAYRVGDRCTESLEAGNRALALIQDVRRRGALLVSATECLVRMERLAEAETILLQVVTQIDPGWKAYYNLGVVQERLGKTSESLKNYELALTGDMPKTVRTRVENKLLHYRTLESVKKGPDGLPPPGSEAVLPTH